MTSKFKRVIAFGLLILLIGELFSRFVIGLGDPPIIVLDKQIEYLFAPSRSYHRFGNFVSYNSKSMRSSEPPGPDEADVVRVLVLGDSVVNGGALTDQSALATEIVGADLGGKYWIGNVSAGSWGPENIHAYINRFGWFGAETAIFVLSTHDLTDLPEFRSSYGEDFPTEAPVSALWEGISRYLPRYIPITGQFLSSPIGPASMLYEADEKQSLGKKELVSLLTESKREIGNVVVLVHPTTDELGKPRSAQRQAMLEAVQSAGVMVYDVNDLGVLHPQNYRDDIHLNQSGQRIYAGLEECIVLNGKSASCPPQMVR